MRAALAYRPEIDGLRAIAVLSLVAFIWLTQAMPKAAFCPFPFCGWELLVGVLLAIAVRNVFAPVFEAPQ